MLTSPVIWTDGPTATLYLLFLEVNLNPGAMASGTRFMNFGCRAGSLNPAAAVAPKTYYSAWYLVANNAPALMALPNFRKLRLLVMYCSLCFDKLLLITDD